MLQVARAFLYKTKGNEDKQAEADEFFSEFNDAIVLIGPTDPLLQDLAPSPMDDYPVPKVGVHANVLKTIFSGIYIGRIPNWSKYLITLALTILVSLMATSTGQHSRLLKLASGMILFGYIFIIFWYFSNLHIVLPLIAPVGAALSTSLIGTFIQLIIEEKQKGRIKNLFGTYVSPEVVHQMIESEEEPHLGGREETITAFFSDIQGFSSFSEHLSPERLVDLMNEYLTAMTDIVQEEGGSLDKYIGDAMVAMFGAPLPMEDHANRACIATQRMQLRQAELRKKWKSEGDKWPEIVFTMQSRIGLNTGLTLIGNMGSEKRFNFTMMGDAVNLAARCESGAKSYGVFTMITEDTMKMAEEQGDGCVYRFLDRIIVKGRQKPVGVYEVVGFKKDLTQKTYDCLEIFDTAINKYLEQNFDKAIELFGKSSEIEPNMPKITPGVSTNP
jgi:adenylate cyclase